MSANTTNVYGRVIEKNTVGTQDGTLVEWTMEIDKAAGKTIKLWTPASGEHYDRMEYAYQHRNDPRNPDKVDVEYTKRKITRRNGDVQTVNWVVSAKS